jgi:hypothetical protein
MGLFRRTRIPYMMFDLERSADEARRLVKCGNIYHRGQDLAWDGREILQELVTKHHGVTISDEKTRAALARIFNIILWGELAAWKISAQLADRLEPLEAKLAATSQTFDEARHFYVMYDYLRELGFQPSRMDKAPQMLLDIVLETDDLAVKLLGMQLTVETIALTLFQAIRELKVEPVLTELLTYYERDEARHVGLGMQYLPTLLAKMNRLQLVRMGTRQIWLLTWALAETWVLRDDFAVLGIDARQVIEKCRRKQSAALTQAYRAIGVDFTAIRNPAAMGINAAIEVLFPSGSRNMSDRARAAWGAFWGRQKEHGLEELAVHDQHVIRTARGPVVGAEPTL